MCGAPPICTRLRRRHEEPLLGIAVPYEMAAQLAWHFYGIGVSARSADAPGRRGSGRLACAGRKPVPGGCWRCGLAPPWPVVVARSADDGARRRMTSGRGNLVSRRVPTLTFEPGSRRPGWSSAPCFAHSTSSRSCPTTPPSSTPCSSSTLASPRRCGCSSSRRVAATWRPYCATHAPRRKKQPQVWALLAPEDAYRDLPDRATPIDQSRRDRSAPPRRRLGSLPPCVQVGAVAAGSQPHVGRTEGGRRWHSRFSKSLSSSSRHCASR